VTSNQVDSAAPRGRNPDQDAVPVAVDEAVGVRDPEADCEKERPEVADAARPDEPEAEEEDADDAFSDAASSLEASEGGDVAELAPATLPALQLSVSLGGLSLSVAGLRPGGGGEREIVRLVASTAALGYEAGSGEATLRVSLRSLSVLDCLCAPAASGEPAFLLTSLPSGLSRSFDTPSPAAEKEAELVRVLYRTWEEGSPSYSGTAAELTLSVATLSLAARRPTLCALAQLPRDLAPPGAHDEAVESGAAAGAAAVAALGAMALQNWEVERPAARELAGPPRLRLRLQLSFHSLLLQLLLENGEELCGCGVERL
jgi:hypothetical protein